MVGSALDGVSSGGSTRAITSVRSEDTNVVLAPANEGSRQIASGKSNGSPPIGSPCSDGTTAGTVDGSRGLGITGWEPDVGDVNCPPLATLSSSVSGSLYLPSAPGEDSEMTLAGLEGGAGL